MRLILILIAIVVLSQTKLVYLSELFRHGARYPVSDIYDGKDTKPLHGRLTGVGMRQQYLLGSYLKRDYVDQNQLFNGTLSPSEVEVFSDGSERCIESAYAHVAGLFQLGQGERLPEGIASELLIPPFETTPSSLTEELSTFAAEFALSKGYQPVPIKDGEPFFPKCTNQPTLIAQRIEQVAVKSAQLQLEQAIFSQKMASLFGLSPLLGTIAGMAELYDVVICDLNLGRPMPPQFTEKQLLQMKFIQNYLFVLLYAQKLSAIYSTPIASGVISSMQRIISGKQMNKKLTIYSGHDTNVAPMLTFLNLTTADCVMKKFRNQTVVGNCAEPVPFASNIQFQLHQRDNIEQGAASNYFVKVKYNGDYYLLCESKSTECDFTDFAARIKHQLVDFNKQCGNK